MGGDQGGAATHERRTMSRVLLLSGGMDSACIAGWQRPDQCLGIDYGQRAANAERRAGSAVAAHLNLPYTHIRVDASEVGGGMMARQPATIGSTPEWWPYRNQLLLTIAASWAIARGHTEVLAGTVAGDGERHADGRQEFYDAVNALLAIQEGTVSVSAPAIHLTASALIEVSGIDDTTLGWTHSCHAGDVPCGRCPGCTKRAETLDKAGRLR
jgi:7-cyano-7-deazaguanine synthase